ncbi:MAG: hypothetical protein ABL982_12985 [Vicinamibacterales bacterium]
MNARSHPATVFGSRIVDLLRVERGVSYTLFNQTTAATNTGLEHSAGLVGMWEREESGPAVSRPCKFSALRCLHA